jgi:hypothetical protein
MTDQLTTKILGIGAFVTGTDMQLVQRTFAAEVRATVELYLEGKIDQWYPLENRPGATGLAPRHMASAECLAMARAA